MKQKTVVSIVILAIVVLYAYMILADLPNVPDIKTPATGRSKDLVNISGTYTFNVTVPSLTNGVNYSNVTFIFYNFSGSIVYKTQIESRARALNQSFNLTINTASSTFNLTFEGVYNITVNVTNSSDIQNFTVSNLSMIDNNAPIVEALTMNSTRPAFLAGTRALTMINVTARNDSVPGSYGSAVHVVFFEIINGTNASAGFNVTANVSGVNTTYFNTTLNLSAMNQANITLIVFANDTAGNSNNSVNTSFIIDGTTPTVTLLNTSDFTTQNTTPSVFFNFTDNVDDIGNCTMYNDTDRVKLGSAVAANGSSSSIRSLVILADTYHTIFVNCTDELSMNINYTARINVTVDTTAPTFSITGTGYTNLADSSVTLQGTTGETASCKYSRSEEAYDTMSGSFGASGTTHSVGISGLSASTSYNYYVKCKDNFENRQGNSAQISFTTPSGGSSGGGGGGGGGGSSSTSAATGAATGETAAGGEAGAGTGGATAGGTSETGAASGGAGTAAAPGQAGVGAEAGKGNLLGQNVGQKFRQLVTNLSWLWITLVVVIIVAAVGLYWFKRR